MNYLQKMTRDTKTRYWVNNPTLAETRLAVENGAFACTTNPAFCAKLLQSDPAYLRKVIAGVLREGTSLADAPEKVYHRACKDLMEIFLPVHRKDPGAGFVTVQEDPRREENFAYIIEASLRAGKLADNYMAKIPVTEYGLKVIAAMVERGVPICATEIFALSQAVEVMEVYEAAAKRGGKRPVMFVTHIAGIMDQYFAETVKKENIAVSPEALALAGTAVALKQYRLFKERGIDCLMLGGGVRNLAHFTNFVGGDMHITINWSTAEELNQLDPNVENAIGREIPKAVIDELLEKLPNFRRAYLEDGMAPDEYADYGPVMLFRTQFMNGFSRLVDEIRMIAAQSGKR